MTVQGNAKNCQYTIRYTFYPDATVDMKTTFSPSGATRRLGLGLQLASGFENVEFYARGPRSNYSDRKTGSYLGRFTTTVDDMVEEQIHPQTYGDHEDLRELLLSNKEEGLTLTVRVDGKASFSLSHFDESKWIEEGSDLWKYPPIGTTSCVSPRCLPISTIGSADWATTVAKATWSCRNMSVPPQATIHTLCD